MPDPAIAGQRIAFGTSGHRGSSLRTSFNEAHILAASEAVVRYRRSRGIDGPLFLARDTHALSEPATRTALEVLVAGGVDVRVDTGDRPAPTPALSHAILTYNRGRQDGLADGIVVTPSHNPPEDGGFKYNPPNGGPADTDVTGWIQEEANRLPRGRGRAIERVPFERARSPRRAATTSSRATSTISDRSSTWTRSGRPGLRIGVDPLGGASVDYWPAIAERYGLDLTVTNDVVDPQFGFMTVDWDGRIRMDPLVAVRDGPPGRAARSLRHCLRQRRRRRPPRDRDAVRRAAQPEPRPVDRGRLPVRRRPRLGPGGRRRQDARRRAR